MRAALRAAALRARGPRDFALARAWRASDFLDAAPRPSRFRACRTARERFGEGVRPRPARPRAESRAAWRRVSAETVPALGLPSFTPARRAFESPIAIACLVERAPCLPSRTWCDLLAHELARLRGGRLALLLVLLGPVQRLLLWHLRLPPGDCGFFQLGAALREPGLLQAVDHVLALPLPAGHFVVTGRDVDVGLAHD